MRYLSGGAAAAHQSPSYGSKVDVFGVSDHFEVAKSEMIYIAIYSIHCITKQAEQIEDTINILLDQFKFTSITMCLRFCCAPKHGYVVLITTHLCWTSPSLFTMLEHTVRV